METFDIIVCGGGSAGFCAAVAAARMGAKTGGEARALDQGPSQGAVNFCLRNLRPARFTAHGQGNGAKMNKCREQQQGRFPLSVLFLSCRAFPF